MSADGCQWVETEAHSPLMTTILEHIKQGEEKEVQVIMDSKSINQHLKQIAWDLIPKVCDFLNEKMLLDRPEVTTTAEAVLVRLAQRAKPKEVLLVLLEQVDTFTNDVKFKALLPSIQQCLLQLPAKRGHSIAIASETLYTHIKKLPAPDEYNLEGEEKKLLQTVDTVRRIGDVIRAMMEFVKPLAENISIKTAENDIKTRDKLERAELIRLVLKMIDYPLAWTDITREEETQTAKPESRVNGERAIAVLAALQPDLLQLLRNLTEENDAIDRKRKFLDDNRKKAIEDGNIPDEIDEYNVEEKYSELSMAVVGYLVFGEQMNLGSLPQVYTPMYILEQMAPHVTHLLLDPKLLVVHKGVILLTGALDRVPPASLTGEFLEWNKIRDVLNNLLLVMVHNKSKEVRTAAVKVIPLWLSKFTYRGRHQFINILLMKETNPSVAGYSIQLLKDQIDNALKSETSDQHFVGSHLERLLHRVFALPNGAKSDLLEQSERIMAALNLLRYLVLRDQRSSNKTGIWNYISLIEKNYCETLHTGINFSKAHYELELQKTHDGTSDILVPEKDVAEMKFSVGGEELPKLTPKQHIDMLQMAIHTFDMMESVLGRVGELIAHQKRTCKDVIGAAS